MSGHPRLYRRNATYYHRAAIPVDIKDTYPKTEETFSLKTTDYREALRLVRIKAVEVDQRFEAHRQKLSVETAPPQADLTDEQIKLVGELHYWECLNDNDWEREHRFGLEEGFSEADADRLFEEHVSLAGEGEQLLKAEYGRGKQNKNFADYTLELLKEKLGIRLDPSSPSLNAAVLEYHKARIRALGVFRERARGEIIETPAEPTKPQSGSSVGKTTLLSEAVGEWIAEKSKTSWVPKTEREHRVWMQHFIDAVGDRAICDYTKADARAFKAMLMKTPPNWTKRKELKGITRLQEAAEKASSLGLDTMSTKNMNKLLGFVGSFWTWAEGQYDEAPGDLFKGMKPRVTQRVREEREPFKTEELTAIFNAPIYRGCASPARWMTEGDLVLRDTGKFWVPLIGLYTGARMGEIIQLRLADVKKEEGVLYFNVRVEDETQSLKTLSSWRKIPVHPKLIELGFDDLLKARKAAKEKRLFLDLKQGSDGYWSTGFSRSFGNLLKKIDVKRSKNAFHSFRHNFEDACRNCGVSADIMDALQGHSGEGMKARYGSGFTLMKLDEAMKQIQYPGLDLSHLIQVPPAPPTMAEGHP